MLRIPGYILKREIGVGGMASVYLAVQTSLERQVALKVMAPALAADQSFSKRFLREARTVAGLSHPHIVSIYDVGITKDQVHYFSMQHMTEGDFSDRIRKGLHELEIIRVLSGIAEALGYAHTRGFVHRDVTPGNILFDASDTPVLTDFGIVKAVTESSKITGTGLCIGTSHYMSPEQARGRAVDPRSDLYSLGAVTYEALSGEPPYDGEDGFAIAYSHVFDPIPKLEPRLSLWQPFIDKALAKDPADRYQSASEMISEMTSFLEITTGEGRIRERPPLLSREGISVAASGGVVRRIKVVAAVLKGAPGSVRFALWDTWNRIMDWSVNLWMTTCRRLFFFLPRERHSLSGLVTSLLLLFLIGMSVDWTGGDLPVTTRVSMAATTEKLSEEQPTTLSPVTGSQAETVFGTSTAPPLSGEMGAREIRLAAERQLKLADNDENEANAMADGDRGTEQGDQVDLDRIPASTDPQQIRIESLLAAANEDLVANRLTTPVDENAVQRFRAVLTLEADNQPARDGLMAVVNRYLDLAESEMRRSEFPKVALYIERSEEVASGLDVPGPVQARMQATRNLAEAAVRKVAEEAHTARRVDEAIALYEAMLIFAPNDEQAIAAIAALRSGVAANQSFSDLLSNGAQGPDLVVVELGPFRLETPVGTLVLADRRKLAVSVGEITVGDYRQFVAATDYYQVRRNRRSCRDQESIWRSSRRRTWEEPGYPQGDDHPVVCVTQEAAQAYAAWLSSETGLSYRLPSEAEWEFLAARDYGKREVLSACKRGNVGDLWLKSQQSDAVVEECEDGWTFTSPARSFLKNDVGVYDLLGNVREWVADCWSEVRPLEGVDYSPSLIGECDQRVVKGTSWAHGTGFGDPARRQGFDANDAFNTVGFRLVRTLD
jgi:formylglycine-generating enzyme required for sulfatase activity